MPGKRQRLEGSSGAVGIVIIGGGFGGLEAAKELGKAGLAVTLVDRRNHHLFQPLLYQVATAALSSPDIAEPIRKVVRHYESVQVLLGEVTAIDAAARTIGLSDGRRLGFDLLVLASGATHSYFGRDEWAAIAPGLKTLRDARRIRSTVLLRFEQAEKTIDPTEQQRLMTFVVVGGGPTGVELAGSLAELSRYTLARDFRNVRPESAKILLIEAGHRILQAFSEEASQYAELRLARLGVGVHTGTAVTDMGDGWIQLGNERLAAGAVLWAAGVAASPLGRQLGVPVDRAGRIQVRPDLSVEGIHNVFALGDVARCETADGPLPGLAQVAKQQGRHLGRSLVRHLRDGVPMAPFVYRSRGNTAIVGRHAAVFEHRRWRITGWFAWLAWAIIHVYLLVGFQHRIQVSLQWLWRYLTYERGARIIMGDVTIDPGRNNDAPS